MQETNTIWGLHQQRVTPAQYLCLNYLRETRLPTEIASHLELTQAAVSLMLLHFFNLGFIEPGEARADRRQRPVRLSDAGRTFLEGLT